MSSRSKIKYTFFLKRAGLTLDQFLSGSVTFDDVKSRLESKDLVGFSDKQIFKYLKSRKPRDEKVITKEQKTGTRRKRKSRAKSTKNKKDSSDFKTWKVPYVEP